MYIILIITFALQKTPLKNEKVKKKKEKDWVRIFTIHRPYKELDSGIYKELLQL